MMIHIQLVALAVLAFINSGSGVSIQTSSSLDGEESYECGRNITLSCMFKKNTSVIVWRKPNNIKRIAQCNKITCSLNPTYIGLYRIAFNMTQGIVNLTIIKVTAEENGTKLICSDGSNSDSYIIRVYDPAVIITKTDSLGDTIQAECGRSLTLSCKFRKNTFAIVWKYSGDISPIVKCKQNNCSLNPKFVGLYNYSLDQIRCMLMLKIIKITKKYNETKLVCSDGTHSDYQIINVGDLFVPRLIEDQNLGAINATSGCVSRDKKVSFKWMKINVVSTEETEIQQMSNYSITSCSNASDCGNDRELQYTQTFFAKPSNKGKYYIKVVAEYENERNKTFKTNTTYTIDEQDYNNIGSESTNVSTIVYVCVVFLLAIAIIMIAFISYCLLVRRRNTYKTTNTSEPRSKFSDGNGTDQDKVALIFEMLKELGHKLLQDRGL